MNDKTKLIFLTFAIMFGCVATVVCGDELEWIELPDAVEVEQVAKPTQEGGDNIPSALLESFDKTNATLSELSQNQSRTLDAITSIINKQDDQSDKIADLFARVKNLEKPSPLQSFVQPSDTCQCEECLTETDVRRIAREVAIEEIKKVTLGIKQTDGSVRYVTVQTSSGPVSVPWRDGDTGIQSVNGERVTGNATRPVQLQTTRETVDVTYYSTPSYEAAITQPVANRPILGQFRRMNCANGTCRVQ